LRRETGAVAALVLLCAALALASPSTAGRNVFLSWPNLSKVLMQVCVTAMLAAGAAVVIIGGGIDLSAGSVLALAAALAAGALKAGAPPAAALAVAVATGAGLGLANGALVARLGLPPFIATLGMMGIARGLTYVYLGGAPLYSFPNGYRTLAEGRVAGMPAPVLIMLALYVGYHLLLARTALGRSIYAIGGNEEAARLSGVSVGTVKAATYAGSGFRGAAGGRRVRARRHRGGGHGRREPRGR
jgi:ribose/xylose/arabinose/galactoside ABC-type transport system permease subunit